MLDENCVANDISDEHFVNGKTTLYQGRTDCFMASTDAYEVEIRGENAIIGDSDKKNSEKIASESISLGLNGGPVTRRKEHHMLQSYSKLSNERTSQLDKLKMFDTFYKEKRNLENSKYLYHPPRLSQDLFQTRLQNVDTNNFNRKINYVEKLPVRKYS